MIPCIITRLVILHYGTLCPSLRTYKALMNKRKGECTDWMKYWTTYAALILIEVFADFLFSWAPFYQDVKLFIVMWIVKSAPQASVWLFDAIIQPLLFRSNDHVDSYLSMTWPKAWEEIQKWSIQICHWSSIGLPLIVRLIKYHSFADNKPMALVTIEDYNKPYADEPERETCEDIMEETSAPNTNESHRKYRNKLKSIRKCMSDELECRRLVGAGDI